MYQIDVEHRLVVGDGVHLCSQELQNMPQTIVNEALLRHACDSAIEFLRRIPGRHVGARASHDELIRALEVPLSEEGEAAGRLFDALAAVGERGTLGSTGP